LGNNGIRDIGDIGEGRADFIRFKRHSIKKKLPDYGNG
jgi:hypothetical protein